MWDLWRDQQRSRLPYVLVCSLRKHYHGRSPKMSLFDKLETAIKNNARTINSGEFVLLSDVKNELAGFKKTALKCRSKFEKQHLFIIAMDKRIEEKQKEYDDSWKTMPLNQLVDRIIQNHDEWLDCQLTPDEPRKLVDLANLCRLLWRRLQKVTK